MEEQKKQDAANKKKATAKKHLEDLKTGKLEKEMEKSIDPELNLLLKNDKKTDDMLGNMLGSLKF